MHYTLHESNHHYISNYFATSIAHTFFCNTSLALALSNVIEKNLPIYSPIKQQSKHFLCKIMTGMWRFHFTKGNDLTIQLPTSTNKMSSQTNKSFLIYRSPTIICQTNSAMRFMHWRFHHFLVFTKFLWNIRHNCIPTLMRLLCRGNVECLLQSMEHQLIHEESRSKCSGRLESLLERMILSRSSGEPFRFSLNRKP